MTVRTSWSSGEVLTAADLTDTFAAKLDASAYTPGLSFLHAESFSGSSAVNIDSVFTTGYDAYEIVGAYQASATPTFLQLQFRASGTASTTGYLTQRMDVSNTSVSATRSSGSVGYFGRVANGIADWTNVFRCTIYNPALAKVSSWTSHAGGPDAGAAANMGLYSGMHNVATAYDGIGISPASGTVTGAIRIFGYQNT